METRQLTKEEFMAKYGEIKVEFSSYYKYTFSYEGILPDGKKITCSYGGNANDIYRYEVCSGNQETINSISPFMGSVYENGIATESFFD